MAYTVYASGVKKNVICKYILDNDYEKSTTFYDLFLFFKCLSQTF